MPLDLALPVSCTRLGKEDGFVTRFVQQLFCKGVSDFDVALDVVALFGPKPLPVSARELTKSCCGELPAGDFS